MSGKVVPVAATDWLHRDPEVNDPVRPGGSLGPSDRRSRNGEAVPAIFGYFGQAFRPPLFRRKSLPGLDPRVTHDSMRAFTNSFAYCISVGFNPSGIFQEENAGRNHPTEVWSGQSQQD